MRALVQRVAWAQVEVDGALVGRIGSGLLVFLGVRTGDGEDEAHKLARKLSSLRVFTDEAGKMNRDVAEAGGAFLVISQFTLYADLKRGKRPSFSAAAPPAEAERLYERFIGLLRDAGHAVETGAFGAHMDVTLHNDGPVTLLLDSEELGG